MRIHFRDELKDAEGFIEVEGSDNFNATMDDGTVKCFRLVSHFYRNKCGDFYFSFNSEVYYRSAHLRLDEILDNPRIKLRDYTKHPDIKTIHVTIPDDMINCLIELHSKAEDELAKLKDLEDTLDSLLDSLA